MPKLEILSLEDTAIGPEGAEALARSGVLAKVQRLALHSNQFGLAGVRALITSPTLPRSTRNDAALVLQHYVTDEQVAAIAAESGVEVRGSKLETLIAVADASP